ncbi:MAG: D-2-hydroxyacid dehydrogenase [Candidatus Dormibacteraeota bacterium]|nr:D-2-hydroxyacid dehydrogenase [Candidatus Dormibacteraeota bacterium]
MPAFAASTALALALLALSSCLAARADESREGVDHLIEAIGLRAAPHPVRERPGWHPPRIVLVGKRLQDLLPQLQQVAAGVKLIGVDAASERQIAAADAVIGDCSPDLLARATHVQWIQYGQAGVERCVQQPLVRERRPLVTNMQRTAGPSIAEHVLALMMALGRHLPFFMHEQSRSQWQNEDSMPALSDLQGKTLLVVGLGGIGTEVASRAHALGMRVVAIRASGRTGPDYVSYVGLPDEMLKLTRDADFVVNCAPLTPQTTGIYNREFFEAMKRSAYFISVGRGRSTVTADLVAALDSGRIAGAGLDVVDPEPLPADHPLWRAPNVIITPHVAGATPASELNYNLLLRENLRRYVAGEAMLSVVDIDRGY